MSKTLTTIGFDREEPHVMGLISHEKFWAMSVDGDETKLALGGHVNPEVKTTVDYQRVRVRKLEEVDEWSR